MKIDKENIYFNEYNESSKKMLDKYGEIKINNIYLVRQPIERFSLMVGDLLTFYKYTNKNTFKIKLIKNYSFYVLLYFLFFYFLFLISYFLFQSDSSNSPSESSGRSSTSSFLASSTCFCHFFGRDLRL